MNEKEVAALKSAFNKGIVYWKPYDMAPALRVERIEVDPHDEARPHIFPTGEVARLAGQAGSFVSLKTSELRDFIVAQPISL